MIFDTDVLIVGSGGAGCFAGIEAAKQGAHATIVTKGRFGKCGATLTGGAGFSCDSKSLHDIFGFLEADPNDSYDAFFEDIVKGGKFMNNQRLLEVHVREAPQRLENLVDWGLKINTVFTAPGHRYPRNARCPGTQFQAVLNKEVRRCGIEIIEDNMIIDLLVHNSRVDGAIGLNIRTGETVVFEAKTVILATGSLARIYPIATTPEELTGDGFAIAYRAGAQLIDMEFPMFVPGHLVWPPALKGICYFPHVVSTEGRLRGWVLNKHGERFLERWDPINKECTTRDIASVATMIEILKGRGSPHGGVFVSLKHLPDNLIDYFAKWAEVARNFKFGSFDLKELLPDFHRHAFEAGPACHFSNGGVRINERCETNISGLYASGEVAGGIHGANRLSGNAFTEFAVWGARAGRFAAEYAKGIKTTKLDMSRVKFLEKRVLKPLERREGIDPIEFKKRIRKLAWEKVGPVRNGQQLEKSLKEIEKMAQEIQHLCVTSKDRIYNREWVESLQVENMRLVLEMIIRTSYIRTESRGAHYREDYPKTDNNSFLKNTIIEQSAGEMCLFTQSIVVTKLEPPRGITPYGPIE